MRKRGKRLLAIILAVILLPLADIQLISWYSNISQNEKFNSEYNSNDAILNTDGKYGNYAEIHKKDKIIQNGICNTADLLQTVENVKQLATYQAYNNTGKKNKLDDTIHTYRGIGNSINNNSSKKNDATLCVDYERNLVGYTYNGQEKFYLCTNLKEKVNPYATNTKGRWYFDKGYTSATASLISAVPAAGSLLGNGLRLGFKTSVRVQKGTKLLESVTHIVGAGATAVRGVTSGSQRIGRLYQNYKNGKGVDTNELLGLGLDVLTTAVSAKSIKANLNSAFALKNAVVKSADGKGNLMPVNLQYFAKNNYEFMDKRFYRVMSEGELEAVKKTEKLRGGRLGTTYFTDSYFKNANKAKSRLALPEKPSYIMEFEIKNTPNISGGTKVQSAYGEIGGGREYFTDDVVRINIINYQKMIGGGK